jgi:hypothetical protein
MSACPPQRQSDRMAAALQNRPSIGDLFTALSERRRGRRTPNYDVSSSTLRGISSTSWPFIVKSIRSGTLSLWWIMNSESSSSM